MVKVLTNGTWTRVEPDEISFFTGLGTGEIRWGDVPYPQKSGYSFDGHLTELKLDGTEFLLGTFTHHNHPIPFVGEFSIHLSVIVNFDDDSLQHAFPSLSFHHTETSNQGPHPDDVVDLPTVSGHDLVYVDNVEYKFVITGFWRDKQKVTQFDSPEGGSNSAGIFARMEATGRRGA